MTTRRDRGESLAGVLALLASLVATAVVAGLIGAGLLMPAIGASGAAARGGVSFFDALPAELEQSPLAQQSRILAADGTTIATFYNENRIIVPLSKIAPVMRSAQVAIEDTRFFNHGGIDPKGVVRAVLRNASSDSTQGASTLTQQYVKLTLQENALYAGDKEAAQAAVRKDLSRKIQELKYAVALEQRISKPQILEGYLNIAYYGDGAYGVEAAARHYFGTTAARLTLPQAALLAGLVQQPGNFDPRKHPKAAVARRNTVLGRMLDTKVITQAQHDKAVATKLALKITATGNGCDTSRYAFFCDYVYRVVLNDKTFGATPAERRRLIFRGGLTIKTTLDPAMEVKAQEAVHKKVAARNKSDVAAAISVVEPGTGKVLAMAQSRPYGRDVKKGETVVNYNVDSGYGGGGFQTGSTFKAFTLAAALADGRPLNSKIQAPPGPHTFAKSDFTTCDADKDFVTGPYKVFNSEGRESGNFTLSQALAKSVNTAFVNLEAQVGTCKVRDMAENLGVHLGRPEPYRKGDKPGTKLRPYASLTLGVEPIAPLTMAAAYASFAAEGMYCSPIAITAVTRLDGKKLETPKASCSQAVDSEVAKGVTAALQTVLTKGTGRGDGIDRPAAGKTGTTNLSMHTWFIGFTPQLASAVWVGHPDKDSPLKNVDVGPRTYHGQVYGATIAAPIWSSFMKSALKGEPVEQFGKPSDKTLNGERVTVPSVTGQTQDEAAATMSAVGLGAQVDPKPVASSAPAGTVVGTSPQAGSRVPPGTNVTLHLSSGTPPPPKTTPPTTPAPSPSPSPSTTKHNPKK